LVKYSCFLLNAADRFKGVEPIDTATVTDALFHAKQLLRRDRSNKAVEVWSQAELIGRVDRERA
jgi:hypothetical protein